MIRWIRIGSVLLCIVSAVLFVLSGMYINRNSDTNGPEIQMDKKEIAVSIDATEEQLLKGIKAVDKKDGDVTESLLIESMSLFTQPGKRKVTIDAYDSNHNVTKVERVIRYTDYISPRIILNHPLRASLNNVNQLMNFVKVEDCLEGDITDSLQITLKDSDAGISLPGEYEMKLMASNSAGDVVEVPVTVELYDYSADSGRAKALLSEYLIYTKVGQEIDPQEYLIGIELRENQYVWSDLEQNIALPYSKGQVNIENAVDVYTPGVYEVVYSLKNTSDYTTNIRMIVIVEE